MVNGGSLLPVTLVLDKYCCDVGCEERGERRGVRYNSALSQDLVILSSEGLYPFLTLLVWMCVFYYPQQKNVIINRYSIVEWHTIIW